MKVPRDCGARGGAGAGLGRGSGQCSSSLDWDPVAPPVLATWGQQRPVPVVSECMAMSPLVATHTVPGPVGCGCCCPGAGRRAGGALWGWGGNCGPWVAIEVLPTAVPCSTPWPQPEPSTPILLSLLCHFQTHGWWPHLPFTATKDSAATHSLVPAMLLEPSCPRPFSACLGRRPAAPTPSQEGREGRGGWGRFLWSPRPLCCGSHLCFRGCDSALHRLSHAVFFFNPHPRTFFHFLYR
uniref:Uncharacterized protein n=1 Tax=Molossus molossus TaxID=27622 RepID=A0A7J8HH25_MOLMO|nr:hypothetical protein HJG59_010973 [Molossus molossus]